MSAEPSMEEILSSIKRIIAEEGDTAPARATRRTPRAAPVLQVPLIDDEQADDEVLELSDPMPSPRAELARPEPVRAEPARAAPAPVVTEPAPPSRAPALAPVTDPIVSPEAAAASRGALDHLSRLMVKPEPGSDGSLEGLVRELLRPMLRDWLDANLPAMVETMVAREIKRITGQAG